MLDLLTNRIAVTHLAALAVALLTALGLAPTGGFNPTVIVAIVMMGAAVVAAALRFGLPGEPLADAKVWWESRTIWVQIVAFAFALLAALGLLPTGIDQAEVVTTILALVAAASAALGKSSSRPIA